MLKNFTVVELLRTRSDAVVTIKKKALRFNTNTAAELHYTPYIQVLMNAKDKQLAIRECGENDYQALPFSKPKGEQKYQLTVGCPSVTDMIRKLMDWDEEQDMNVPGVYLADEKALIFDLHSAYHPVKKGGAGSKQAKEAALDIAMENLNKASDKREETSEPSAEQQSDTVADDKTTAYNGFGNESYMNN